MIDPHSTKNQLDLFCDRMYTVDDMKKAFEAGGKYKISMFSDKPIPEFDIWIKTFKD